MIVLSHKRILVFRYHKAASLLQVVFQKRPCDHIWMRLIWTDALVIWCAVRSNMFTLEPIGTRQFLIQQSDVFLWSTFDGVHDPKYCFATYGTSQICYRLLSSQLKLQINGSGLKHRENMVYFKPTSCSELKTSETWIFTGSRVFFLWRIINLVCPQKEYQNMYQPFPNTTLVFISSVLRPGTAFAKFAGICNLLDTILAKKTVMYKFIWLEFILIENVDFKVWWLAWKIIPNLKKQVQVIELIVCIG